ALPIYGVEDVADRLALHAGGVREQLADGDAGVRAVREVLLDGVVEVEPPLVAQRHDRDGGEGLGVARDRVLGVLVRGVAGGVEVDGADAAEPLETPLAGDPGARPGTRPSVCAMR